MTRESLLSARNVENVDAMLDPEFLRYCKNPLCERAVPADFLGRRQVEYCCTACATAAEGCYEIHEDGPLAHSGGCDERWQERVGRTIRYVR